MRTQFRKLSCVVSMLLLIVMCFVGCGSSKEAKTETDTSKTETTDSTTDGQEPATEEKVEISVFIAASLLNSMEDIKAEYEKSHPNVTILYNAESSGTLQTQIEEGAECDIFFSAATKQMDALKEEDLADSASVTNLLQNKIVLIKSSGAETAVTGFEDLTKAKNMALADESVPVGQYARTLLENMGTLEDVMKMEINECGNVTEVLTAVAEGSNEIGIVYATDAASMPDSVEIIAEATDEQVDPAIYPVGLIKNEQASDAQTAAAKEFLDYLTTDQTVHSIFENAGFAFP